MSDAKKVQRAISDVMERVPGHDGEDALIDLLHDISDLIGADPDLAKSAIDTWIEIHWAE
jgi:hypothetical protein